MDKEEFLAQAEKANKTPLLYRSKRHAFYLVEGYFLGHSFFLYDPFSRQVKEYPNYGDAHSRLFTLVTPPPLYQHTTIDTQAR